MDSSQVQLTGYQDFDEAAGAVLAHLRERLPFSAWLITRTDEESDDWIILQAEDTRYGIASGDTHRWSETYCARMTAGQGPMIAPEADQFPAYRDAPIGDRYPIGAYIGYPLRSPDGDLLGTLCAIDPEPQSEEIHREASHIAILARLLASLMDAELEVRRQSHQMTHLREAATRDPLTGTNNRRGWEELLAFKEQVCASLGTEGIVILADVADLEEVNERHGREAGDRLLRTTAEILKEGVPRPYHIARVGGAEFGILALECGEAEARELVDQLRARFEDKGIRATFGFGVRDPSHSLWQAKDKAERAVYEAQRRGEAPRTT